MTDKQPKYNCFKCDKNFHTNIKLNRHLNKKFPCNINTRQCTYCKRLFYDSSTKKRHEISCKSNHSNKFTSS